MRRFLVVANQTLAGEQLFAKAAELSRNGDCSFYVVVPATPGHKQLVWSEGEAHAIAERRLASALQKLGDLGCTVDGEVGDASPMQAITDALEHVDADEILLSTLPPGASRWLRQELPRRVERRFGLPVVHVVARQRPAAMH